MSYRKWREEAIYECALYGISRVDTQALLTIANRRQVSNEIACSIPETDEQREKRERNDERVAARLHEIADRIGWTVDEGGDPRGCSVKLLRGKGQGQITLYIPGRGLPARCFK